MKKIMTIVLSLIMALCVFAMGGCTFQTDVDDDKGKVDIEENTDAEIQLSVGVLAKQSERDIMQAWINAYQKKNQNVGISIKKVFQGMPDLISWKSTGELPDIVWTSGDQHAPYSVDGYFQDLSDTEKFAGGSEFFDGFYDAVVKSTHYSDEDNGIWFVPRDYNRLVIYYNKTAFADAGVDLPVNNWTWEDFENTCNALMDAGVKKAIEWRLWAPVFTTMLTNYGGSYFDESGNLTLASDNTKACYDKLVGMLDSSTGYAMGGDGGSFTAYSGDLGGAVPMIVDVRPQLTGYCRAASSAGWQLDAAPFPNFKQADGSDGFVGAGCSGYAISSQCTDEKNRQAAWDFLKWCMSEEGYDALAENNIGDIVPALKSLSAGGSWREYSYFDEIQVSAEPFVATNTKDIFLNYYNVQDVKYYSDIITMSTKFWQGVGEKSYKSAIDEFVASFNALVK